jgi:SET domain-containing protein
VTSHSEPLDVPRDPALRVVLVPGKDRAVVAVEPIRHGQLLEVAPVILLRPQGGPPETSTLLDYPFAWDEPPFTEAMALGIVSLVNHSTQPNARIACDYANRAMRLIAITDIGAGEEVTLDYDIPLWFEPRVDA